MLTKVLAAIMALIMIIAYVNLLKSQRNRQTKRAWFSASIILVSAVFTYFLVR